MKHEKKVSIIVPLYNGEHYIEKCINSILKNTYKNLEIIIIDDGSNDNSYKICNSLRAQDSRIRFFSKNNEGIAKTRKYGIDKATGEYICFADQDDIVYENMYEILVENIENFNSDVVIASYDLLKGEKKEHFILTENNLIITKDVMNDYIIRLSNACFRHNYLNDNMKYSWTIWNCMYKKSIIDKFDIQFKSFTNYEDDFLFNLDYFIHCKSISFEKQCVYAWRQNLKSESHSKKYVYNCYENNKLFNEYVIKKLEHINGFEKDKWNELFAQKNFSTALINEANLKNKKTNKESLKYLSEIYTSDIKETMKFDVKFNFKKFLLSGEYLTYKLCKKGNIKCAFYINKYFYNSILFRLENVVRIIVYKFVK